MKVSASIRAIRRLRGILKRKPSDLPLVKEMAQHKRREKQLEDRLFRRRISKSKTKG